MHPNVGLKGALYTCVPSRSSLLVLGLLELKESLLVAILPVAFTYAYISVLVRVNASIHLLISLLGRTAALPLHARSRCQFILRIRVKFAKNY